MTKYQKQKFKDYVESLCCLSQDIAESAEIVSSELFGTLIKERRELKIKFIQWFSKQIK